MSNCVTTAAGALCRQSAGQRGSVLPVSTVLDDFHGISGVALSVPCIVDASGAQQTKSVYVSKDGAANVLPAVDELAKKIKNALVVSDVIAEIEVKGTKNLDKDVVVVAMTDERMPLRHQKNLKKLS